MIGQTVRGLGIVGALALVIGTSSGQPTTFDKVVVRDKKDGSTKTHDGNLKLAPGGFQIVGAKDKLVASIAVDDLVKFTPGELPGIERGEVLGLITTEEKRTKAEYEKAQVGYANLQKKAKGSPEATRRYLDFKHALITTRIADESGDDERWTELADTATKAWGTFLAEYKGSWEVWPATRVSARLLTELNKQDELARLWDRTTKIADLPADLKLEASLRTLDAQISSGAFDTAILSAGALGKATGPGAAKDKLAIYELAAKAGTDKDYAGAIKKIEEAIAKTKDPVVRGVGYGMIGELHLLAGKPRDAMWAFLWVETVYSQDKDDVLKAMSRLVEVFKAQGDEDRAKSYREKIRRYRDEFTF